MFIRIKNDWNKSVKFKLRYFGMIRYCFYWFWGYSACLFQFLHGAISRNHYNWHSKNSVHHRLFSSLSFLPYPFFCMSRFISSSRRSFDIMVFDKMVRTRPREETVRAKVSVIRFVYPRKSAELTMSMIDDRCQFRDLERFSCRFRRSWKYSDGM